MTRREICFNHINNTVTVLATCDIRLLHEAFESTFPRLSLLLIPQGRGESQCMYLLIFKKGIVAVQSIVTFIKRLTRMCLQLLQQHFVDWTKPTNTSLLVGTMTDLARTKSELVAENALLRQQLILLRRQVKRPAVLAT